MTTPYIDEFAEEAVLFEATCSAHIPTTPGYSSMLTGRDCFGTEVVALRQQGGLTDKVKTLPEILAEEGRRHLTVALPSREAAEGSRALRLLVGNRPARAHVETERDRLRATSRSSSSRSGSATATSSLPGVIRRILLEAGDAVEEGTPILTLEAMKMENDVRAETAGKLKSILVKEGQVVNAGDSLAEIEVEE